MASLQHAVMACLATRPAAEISVNDIARAAGLSRRTFYRFFESREALFAQVLHTYAIAIAADVTRFIERCDDFTSAVVDGTMETLRLIEGNSIFKALANANTMLDIMHFDEDGEHGQLFAITWAKVFAQARASGQLRSDIDDRQAAEWLHAIHYLLTLRPDLDDAAKRSMLIDFVVPSLVPGRSRK